MLWVTIVSPQCICAVMVTVFSTNGTSYSAGSKCVSENIYAEIQHLLYVLYTMAILCA